MLKLQETTKYRVDTEKEAIEMIEQARNDAAKEGYDVKKSSYTAKNKKAKGAIIDEWFVVEICLKYNDEQLPEA